MAKWLSHTGSARRFVMSAAAVCAFAFVGSAGEARAQEKQTPVEVGQAAPDFTLESSDGKTYTLSEMKDRKSLVLIFFRGTW